MFKDSKSGKDSPLFSENLSLWEKIQHFFQAKLASENKKAAQQSEPLVMLLSISADSF